MGENPQPSSGYNPQYAQESMYAALQHRMRLPDGMLSGGAVDPVAPLPPYPIVAMYQSKAHASVGPAVKAQLVDFLGEGQTFDVSERSAGDVLQQLESAMREGQGKAVSDRVRVVIFASNTAVYEAMQSMALVSPSAPPIAIVPIGSSNDLSRCMNWGTHHVSRWLAPSKEPQYLLDLLACVASASPQLVDCWQLRMSHGQDNLFASVPPSLKKGTQAGPTNYQTLVWNSLYVALDNDAAAGFDQLCGTRGRSGRKGGSVVKTLLGGCFCGAPGAAPRLRVRVQGRDGHWRDVSAASTGLSALLVENLPKRWASGQEFWDRNSADAQPAAYDDGLVEVYGVKTGGLRPGWTPESLQQSVVRLDQGAALKVYLQAGGDADTARVYMLKDGEPWWQDLPPAGKDVEPLAVELIPNGQTQLLAKPGNLSATASLTGAVSAPISSDVSAIPGAAAAAVGGSAANRAPPVVEEAAAGDGNQLAELDAPAAAAEEMPEDEADARVGVEASPAAIGTAAAVGAAASAVAAKSGGGIGKPFVSDDPSADLTVPPATSGAVGGAAPEARAAPVEAPTAEQPPPKKRFFGLFGAHKAAAPEARKEAPAEHVEIANPVASAEGEVFYDAASNAEATSSRISEAAGEVATPAASAPEPVSGEVTLPVVPAAAAVVGSAGSGERGAAPEGTAETAVPDLAAALPGAQLPTAETEAPAEGIEAPAADLVLLETPAAAVVEPAVAEVPAADAPEVEEAAAREPDASSDLGKSKGFFGFFRRAKGEAPSTGLAAEAPPAEAQAASAEAPVPEELAAPGAELPGAAGTTPAVNAPVGPVAEEGEALEAEVAAPEAPTEAETPVTVPAIAAGTAAAVGGTILAASMGADRAKDAPSEGGPRDAATEAPAAELSTADVAAPAVEVGATPGAAALPLAGEGEGMLQSADVHAPVAGDVTASDPNAEVANPVAPSAELEAASGAIAGSSKKGKKSGRLMDRLFNRTSKKKGEAASAPLAAASSGVVAASPGTEVGPPTGAEAAAVPEPGVVVPEVEGAGGGAPELGATAAEAGEAAPAVAEGGEGTLVASAAAAGAGALAGGALASTRSAGAREEAEAGEGPALVADASDRTSLVTPTLPSVDASAQAGTLPTLDATAGPLPTGAVVEEASAEVEEPSLALETPPATLVSADPPAPLPSAEAEVVPPLLETPDLGAPGAASAELDGGKKKGMTSRLFGRLFSKKTGEGVSSSLDTHSGPVPEAPETRGAPAADVALPPAEAPPVALPEVEATGVAAAEVPAPVMAVVGAAEPLEASPLSAAIQALPASTAEAGAALNLPGVSLTTGGGEGGFRMPTEEGGPEGALDMALMSGAAAELPELPSGDVPLPEGGAVAVPPADAAYESGPSGAPPAGGAAWADAALGAVAVPAASAGLVALEGDSAPPPPPAQGAEADVAADAGASAAVGTEEPALAPGEALVRDASPDMPIASASPVASPEPKKKKKSFVKQMMGRLRSSKESAPSGEGSSSMVLPGAEAPSAALDAPSTEFAPPEGDRPVAPLEDVNISMPSDEPPPAPGLAAPSLPSVPEEAGTERGVELPAGAGDAAPIGVQASEALGADIVPDPAYVPSADVDPAAAGEGANPVEGEGARGSLVAVGGEADGDSSRHLWQQPGTDAAVGAGAGAALLPAAMGSVRDGTITAPMDTEDLPVDISTAAEPSGGMLSPAAPEPAVPDVETDAAAVAPPVEAAAPEVAAGAPLADEGGPSFGGGVASMPIANLAALTSNVPVPGAEAPLIDLTAPATDSRPALAGEPEDAGAGEGTRAPAVDAPLPSDDVPPMATFETHAPGAEVPTAVAAAALPSADLAAPAGDEPAAVEPADVVDEPLPGVPLAEPGVPLDEPLGGAGPLEGVAPTPELAAVVDVPAAAEAEEGSGPVDEVARPGAAASVGAGASEGKKAFKFTSLFKRKKKSSARSLGASDGLPAAEEEEVAAEGVSGEVSMAQAAPEPLGDAPLPDAALADAATDVPLPEADALVAGDIGPPPAEAPTVGAPDTGAAAGVVEPGDMPKELGDAPLPGAALAARTVDVPVPEGSVPEAPDAAAAEPLEVSFGTPADAVAPEATPAPLGDAALPAAALVAPATEVPVPESTAPLADASEPADTVTEAAVPSGTTEAAEGAVKGQESSGGLLGTLQTSAAAATGAAIGAVSAVGSAAFAHSKDDSAERVATKDAPEVGVSASAPAEAPASTSLGVEGLIQDPAAPPTGALSAQQAADVPPEGIPMFEEPPASFQPKPSLSPGSRPRSFLRRLVGGGRGGPQRSQEKEGSTAGATAPIAMPSAHAVDEDDLAGTATLSESGVVAPGAQPEQLDEAALPGAALAAPGVDVPVPAADAPAGDAPGPAADAGVVAPEAAPAPLGNALLPDAALTAPATDVAAPEASAPAAVAPGLIELAADKDEVPGDATAGGEASEGGVLGTLSSSVAAAASSATVAATSAASAVGLTSGKEAPESAGAAAPAGETSASQDASGIPAEGIPMFEEPPASLEAKPATVASVTRPRSFLRRLVGGGGGSRRPKERGREKEGTASATTSLAAPSAPSAEAPDVAATAPLEAGGAGVVAPEEAPTPLGDAALPMAALVAPETEVNVPEGSSPEGTAPGLPGIAAMPGAAAAAAASVAGEGLQEAKDALAPVAPEAGGAAPASTSGAAFAAPGEPAETAAESGGGLATLSSTAAAAKETAAEAVAAASSAIGLSGSKTEAVEGATGTLADGSLAPEPLARDPAAPGETPGGPPELDVPPEGIPMFEEPSGPLEPKPSAYPSPSRPRSFLRRIVGGGRRSKEPAGGSGAGATTGLAAPSDPDPEAEDAAATAPLAGTEAEGGAEEEAAASGALAPKSTPPKRGAPRSGLFSRITNRKAKTPGASSVPSSDFAAEAPSAPEAGAPTTSPPEPPVAMVVPPSAAVGAAITPGTADPAPADVAADVAAVPPYTAPDEPAAAAGSDAPPGVVVVSPAAVAFEVPTGVEATAPAPGPEPFTGAPLHEGEPPAGSAVAAEQEDVPVYPHLKVADHGTVETIIDATAPPAPAGERYPPGGAEAQSPEEAPPPVAAPPPGALPSPDPAGGYPGIPPADGTPYAGNLGTAAAPDADVALRDMAPPAEGGLLGQPTYPHTMAPPTGAVTSFGAGLGALPTSATAQEAAAPGEGSQPQPSI